MRTVLTRTPVVHRHPVTGEYIALVRGMEFADDDPVVQSAAWAFTDPGEPERVTSTPVEQATAAPGEKRATKRS